MLVKLCIPGISRYVSVDHVQTETLGDGRVSVRGYANDNEAVKCIVGDRERKGDSLLHSSTPVFDVAYIMDAGKTIDIVRPSKVTA